MEVVCISKNNFRHHDKLEIGKTYEGYKGNYSWGISEFVRGRYVFVGYYHLYQFITKDEYRELQLNKIV